MIRLRVRTLTHDEFYHQMSEGDTNLCEGCAYDDGHECNIPHDELDCVVNTPDYSINYIFKEES